MSEGRGRSYRPMPVGARGFKAERCPKCWRLVEDCVCSLVTPARTALRLVMLSHWKEAGRSSNTGRLVWLAIDNLDLRFFNLPDGTSEPLDDLDPDDCLLLFPDEEAVPITTVATSEATTLVVLDATWRQVRRMIRKTPLLRRMKKVRLPEGRPSEFAARRQFSPERLCTAEAVARALEALGEHEAASAVMAPFESYVSACLRERGRDVPR